MLRTSHHQKLLAVAAISAALLIVGCGRVTRQMHINSDPQGALVYLNGQEVGRTPCTVDFTWYGKYDLIVRKEGYSSLKTTQKIYAPWWQWIPLDLAADVTPGHKVDKRYYHYLLKSLPDQSVEPELLIDRANSMRPMLESGQYTRKIPVGPATNPSTQAAEDAAPTTIPATETGL